MTSKEAVQLMDSDTLFVHLFCLKLAKFDKDVRHMSSFYVLQDTRPGGPQANFDLDAVRYAEYQRMFRP